MKKTTWIRAVVYSAILAWPAVETYRWYQAHQALAASTELERKVSTRLAESKAKQNTQVARQQN
jgi:hypothetical protein